MRQHVRKEAAGYYEGAGEVRLDDPVPLVQRRLLDGACADDPGDVRHLGAGSLALDQGSHGLRVGRVDPLCPVERHDVDAPGTGELRYGESDAGGVARDQQRHDSSRRMSCRAAR